MLPAGVLRYINVTITNSQGVSTSSPYNQVIQVDSSAFQKYESSDLSNVIWFDSNGDIIPSWIESNLTTLSTNTQYWLRIPFSIPAESSRIIYMGFTSTSTDLFHSNGNQGVAP